MPGRLHCVARGRTRLMLSGLLLPGLSGCMNLTQQRLAPGEEPVLIGAAARDNRTPMDPAFACFNAQLSAAQRPPVVIAVGDVRDFTGKYSVNEGTAITQGGALMVSSALGKLAGPVTLAERFDPTIAERELGYTDRRQLGDGGAHSVTGAGGVSSVPWLPYYGGSIAASDYYIVGGITELNYNIRSGGAELRVGQLGPKLRTYTQSVAIDLRIVDTRSLLVARTVSLTKQFTGYEVGFNTFRFFGSELFDVNIGAKGQEPLQLGIRTTLEEATMRLVGAVARVDPEGCIAMRSWDPSITLPPIRFAARTASVLKGAVAAAQALNTAAQPGPESGEGVALMFEPGSSDLGGSALAVLDRIASAARSVPVELRIAARDVEVLEPAKRDALTDQRIAAVIASLAARGIGKDRIALRWRPAPTDTSVHRGEAGAQDLARLRIGG
jgi:curli biogenesis system outer membrane secretion channel CsgG